MIYYIAEINNDTVTLKNNIEEKTVRLEDLKGMDDTIIGFNRVTGKLKVSSLEDAYNYVVSKYKLAGIDYIDEYVDNYEIHQTDNGLEVTISVGDVEYKEVRTIFRFNYFSMFRELDEYNMAFGLGLGKDNTLIPLKIKFDLYFTGKGVSYCFDDYFDNSYIITGVSFTDRSDLSNVKQLEGIFRFSTVIKHTEDATIDMSNLVVNRATRIKNIISGYIMNIIPPKFVGEFVEVPLFEGDYHLISYEPLEHINNFVKGHCPNSDKKLPIRVCSLNSIILSELQNYSNIKCDFQTMELQLDSKEESLLDSFEFIFLDEFNEYYSGTLSIYFTYEFFDFVHQIAEEDMIQMYNYMANTITGDFSDFQREIVSQSEFIEKYEGILKATGGLIPCKLLTKICYSNSDYMALEYLSDCCEFSINQFKFIMLLTIFLIDIDDVQGCTDNIEYFVPDVFKHLTKYDIECWESD